MVVGEVIESVGAESVRPVDELFDEVRVVGIWIVVVVAECFYAFEGLAGFRDLLWTSLTSISFLIIFLSTFLILLLTFLLRLLLFLHSILILSAFFLLLLVLNRADIDLKSAIHVDSN